MGDGKWKGSPSLHDATVWKFYGIHVFIVVHGTISLAEFVYSDNQSKGNTPRRKPQVDQLLGWVSHINLSAVDRHEPDCTFHCMGYGEQY